MGTLMYLALLYILYHTRNGKSRNLPQDSAFSYKRRSRTLPALFYLRIHAHLILQNIYFTHFSSKIKYALSEYGIINIPNYEVSFLEITLTFAGFERGQGYVSGCYGKASEMFSADLLPLRIPHNRNPTGIADISCRILRHQHGLSAWHHRPN